MTDFITTAFTNTFSGKTLFKKLGKARRKAFNHIGAIVRKAARQQIRTRKRVSNPGEPPTNRTGKLKNSILYAMDYDGNSVLIGPKAFGPEKAGKTLEKGGVVEVPKSFRKRLFKAGAPPNQGGIGPVVIDRIGERPRLHRWMQLWGNFDPEINKLDGYARVLWRRLRTANEARHAEKTYSELIGAREFARLTDKVKGRVEARPFMSSGRDKARQAIRKAWEESLR